SSHVENPLIKDRKARPVLRHDVRREARIAGAFVAEAMASAIDDDPALLDRGPRQQAAMRIGNSGVALISADIAQGGSEFVPPQHCFAGAAARAEILRSTNARAEARYKVAVSGKAVDCQNDLGGKNALMFAADGRDV